MLPPHPRLFALAVLIVGLVSSVAAQEPLSRVEIAKRAKAATALVEIKPRYGSAFCVHPAGLFVTNEHVIRQVGDSSTVTLVLDAGLKTQKVLKAKIVRRDRDLDLALLRADGNHQLPTLALGSDAQLTELTELIAFGFPFGTALAKQKEEYPAISVNVGSVTSLRRDPKGDLARIQLDAVLNPGNSGGPVVDREGKVVGVVVSGIQGAGVNMAIPVSHLQRFLVRPEIVFTPPVITQANQQEPAEFQAKAIALLPSTSAYELELIVRAAGSADRTVAMKPTDGTHRAQLVPFPGAKSALLIRVEVKYSNSAVTAMTEDRKFTVGGQPVRLSEVRSIRPGPKAEVLLSNSQKLEGPLAELDALPVTVGGQALSLGLANAVEVGVVAPDKDTSLTCTVVAKQGGKEVGRHETILYLEGTERASLEAIRDGKFLKPRRAAAPTSYLKVVSTPGDYIGQGKSYSYQEQELTVRWSTRNVSLNVGGWHAEFAPPRGGTLSVGEYRNAKRFPFNDDSPGISFGGNGRGCNMIAGKFAIWELEVQGNQVTKLAVDFFQQCEGRGPPLYGMLRFKSSFE